MIVHVRCLRKDRAFVVCFCCHQMTLGHGTLRLWSRHLDQGRAKGWPSSSVTALSVSTGFLLRQARCPLLHLARAVSISVCVQERFETSVSRVAVFSRVRLAKMCVILKWPERIKTQPHDDRDNCFLHFHSKGPCGMTVNNYIDDDSATKRVILTPVTLIVRESDRRDLIPQGAPSCRNAIDLNGRFCPNHQHYHQDPSFPFASSFCRGQIHQWEPSQANTIGDTHSIDHFAHV